MNVMSSFSLSTPDLSQSKDSCKEELVQTYSPALHHRSRSKSLPPTKETAKAEVSNHNSTSTPSQERCQSRIYHLRCFNNWIKNMLITEFIEKIKSQQQPGDPLRVLDMCCGKGGDLHKYAKRHISHLICTDIAQVSLEQCKSRYKTMKKRNPWFSAEFFVCDCFQEKLKNRLKSPWIEHNLVSCQFALHFSFESYPQADRFFSNVSEGLKSGGFLIATIPNSYEIMRRLKNSEIGKSFGNDFYNVEFLCDIDPPPLFGAKYLFQLEGVVDCFEYLIHFPTMVKLCKKHGLKLEKVNTFAEYYDEFYQKGKEILEKTGALQTLCYEMDSEIDENYSHVKNFAKKTKSSSNYYGTLSKEEWDVATMYLVCAFRKCPNTWDDKWNPIYDFDS